MTATGTRAWRVAISAMRSSPSPASTAPTISRWAPRGDGSDSGADNTDLGADLDARVCLQHVLAGLAGTDAHGILDGKDEDLPVADLPGASVPQDGVDDHASVTVLDHALHLELRPQVDRDRRAAVLLGDALLPSAPLHLGDRDAGESLLQEVLPDRLERLVPDVRDNHLHDVTPAVVGPLDVMAVTGCGAPPRARSATGPV